MKSPLLMMVAAALLLAGPAAAQTHGEGNVAFGVGGFSGGYASDGIVQFGAGGEAVIDNHVAIGGEALLNNNRRDSWIESALKVSYRFDSVGKGRRVLPFLTGGYSLLLPYPANGPSVGGGLTYWFGHQGVTIEVRDVFLNAFSDGGRSAQIWIARLGFAFR